MKFLCMLISLSLISHTGFADTDSSDDNEKKTTEVSITTKTGSIKVSGGSSITIGSTTGKTGKSKGSVVINDKVVPKNIVNGKSIKVKDDRIWIGEKEYDSKTWKIIDKTEKIEPKTDKNMEKLRTQLRNFFGENFKDRVHQTLKSWINPTGIKLGFVIKHKKNKTKIKNKNTGNAFTIQRSGVNLQ